MTNGDWLRAHGDKELAAFVMGAALFVIRESADEDGEININALAESIMEVLEDEHLEQEGEDGTSEC